MKAQAERVADAAAGDTLPDRTPDERFTGYFGSLWGNGAPETPYDEHRRPGRWTARDLLAPLRDNRPLHGVEPRWNGAWHPLDVRRAPSVFGAFGSRGGTRGLVDTPVLEPHRR